LRDRFPPYQLGAVQVTGRLVYEKVATLPKKGSKSVEYKFL
jgi:hypothetical protein